MPFRSAFTCLWCGRPWTTRSPRDLEGWAQLCPECLGRAGDNPFLRARLRTAITDRSAAAGSGTRLDEATPPPTPGVKASQMVDDHEARADESDDWYLRRGRYARGPVHDTAWHAELDAAGRWLDGLPIRGRIVELAAGTGWWSPLLAAKGELTAYDAVPAALDRARDRLLAHGLRAHLHVRDAWSDPEGDPADALFAGFWLRHVGRERMPAFLALARRWLRPGGRLVLIDALADPLSGAADQPSSVGDPGGRRPADGPSFTVGSAPRRPEEIAAALSAAGFTEVQVSATGRFFLLATAVAA